MPARQPGSGEATGASLCQSRAELLAIGARVERAKVSTLLGFEVRAIPIRKYAVRLSTHHARATGSKPLRNSRPAAAVIPAPIAYIKVVAVKKLVVEPWAWLVGPPHRVH